MDKFEFIKINRTVDTRWRMAKILRVYSSWFSDWSRSWKDRSQQLDYDLDYVIE